MRISKTILVYLLCLAVVLISCTATKNKSERGPTDKPSTAYDESVVPGKGQPPFPKLGQYWVIDHGCNFDLESTEFADEVFEKLRQDHIAEVVVICQTGVKNLGPYNDEKIWTMDWGNWIRLGDKDDKRGVVILIRPDVSPEQNRITIQNSIWIYQNTVMDYYPVIEEAANYANWGDFDGALESVARGLDETLRRVVKPTKDR